SSMTMLRPRTTALLKVQASTANAIIGIASNRNSPARSRRKKRISRAATSNNPGRRGNFTLASSWGPGLPVRIDAHARPQPLDLGDRIGPDRKGPLVEITGRTGRAPPRVLAFCRDHADLDDDLRITQCRDSHGKPVTDLEACD